jgi:hypothetical protein
MLLMTAQPLASCFLFDNMAKQHASSKLISTADDFGRRPRVESIAAIKDIAAALGFAPVHESRVENSRCKRILVSRRECPQGHESLTAIIWRDKAQQQGVHSQKHDDSTGETSAVASPRASTLLALVCGGLLQISSAPSTLAPHFVQTAAQSDAASSSCAQRLQRQSKP